MNNKNNSKDAGIDKHAGAGSISNDKEKEPKVKNNHFFIGQKKFETPLTSLTVRQILVDFALVDPANKTLAVKKEGGFNEYRNLDEVISIDHPLHFTLFDNTPTTVS